MLCVGERHAQGAHVAQGIPRVFSPLVAAGHVEDFHASGPGVFEELQGAGVRLGPLAATTVPDGVVEELLVLAEQLQ